MCGDCWRLIQSPTTDNPKLILVLFRGSRKVPGVFAEENHDRCKAVVRFLAEERPAAAKTGSGSWRLMAIYRHTAASVRGNSKAVARMFTTVLRQHCGYWQLHHTACALMGVVVPTMSRKLSHDASLRDSLSAQLSRETVVYL